MSLFESEKERKSAGAARFALCRRISDRQPLPTIDAVFRRAAGVSGKARSLQKPSHRALNREPAAGEGRHFHGVGRVGNTRFRGLKIFRPDIQMKDGVPGHAPSPARHIDVVAVRCGYAIDLDEQSLKLAVER